MIEGDHRIIVVFGMAHSGTTIIAKTLDQSSQIHCVRNGTEAWIYENTYLPTQNAPAIQEELNLHPNKYILLKRPWCEQNHEFYKNEMPNAHFYGMFKGFTQISSSWSRPNSFVNKVFRNSPELQKERYETCCKALMEFKEKVGCKNFKIIFYNELIVNPSALFEEINQKLKLNKFGFEFNVSEIKKGNNVKMTLTRPPKNVIRNSKGGLIRHSSKNPKPPSS